VIANLYAIRKAGLKVACGVSGEQGWLAPLREPKDRGMNMAADWDEVDLMDKDEHIEQASRAMKAMSHPLRLKILCVLGDKEVSVQDIVDHVGTSQSNISQHLAILRDKGVLRTRKDANRVFYRVGDTRTLKLLGMMRDVFCGFTK
jgi:ArsR family transcriptional regulator